MRYIQNFQFSPGLKIFLEIIKVKIGIEVQIQTGYRPYYALFCKLEASAPRNIFQKPHYCIPSS